MPLQESEAIVLRASAFAEADKLVSFFTRACGRLRGVAPNARRSRRRFGAALEPLSHVRAWFFERAERELVRLSEVELIEPFWETRGDYERSLALNQVVELAELLLPEREASERAFRLLVATLRGFKHSDSVWLPLTYYQLWSVRLAGWLPALEECSRCHKRLEQEPGYISPARGLLLCPRCRRPGMRLLSPGSRQTALEGLAKPLSRIPEGSWNRKQMQELQNYLLDVVEHQSERKLVTREMLHEEA